MAHRPKTSLESACSGECGVMSPTGSVASGGGNHGDRQHWGPDQCSRYGSNDEWHMSVVVVATADASTIHSRLGTHANI